MPEMQKISRCITFHYLEMLWIGDILELEGGGGKSYLRKLWCFIYKLEIANLQE